MKNYQICNRCVMSSKIEDITFNSDGNCSYCEAFLKELKKISSRNPENLKTIKNKFISKIISDGKNKKYDCIVGVSGGLDSSFALTQAVENGLRPLAVHMDNGWNSELAQNNIENLVKLLDVDLFTYVIDWQEYKKLMQSFFKADVIDVELLTDNAMMAVNYRQASKFNVNYILSGTNHSTEGMKMPRQMNWFKYDKRNIKYIAKTFSETNLKTYPAIGTIDYVWYEFVKKIHWVPFLNYFDYKKEDALKYLQEKYNFKAYPYKHYESVFTRFYQGYILPKKFNVDKRMLHFSTLIVSKQMKREDALNDLKKIPYSSLEKLESDKEFFLKKMNWDEKELIEYLDRPPKLHSNYKTERPFFYLLVKIYKLIFGKDKKRNFI